MCGLFQRSTRSLTLTEAGQLFLGEVSASLHTIQNAVANLASAEGLPAGTLKVSMGTVFGRLYIVPLLGEFLRRFPAINPDWHFDNRQVDLIGQGFDAAIGGGFELPQGRGRAQADTGPSGVGGLCRTTWRRMRRSLEPDDLKHHDGILIRSPQTGRVRSWQLTSRTQQHSPLTLKARMTMSDSEAACATATQGLGHCAGEHAVCRGLSGGGDVAAGAAGLVCRRWQHFDLLRRAQTVAGQDPGVCGFYHRAVCGAGGWGSGLVRFEPGWKPRCGHREQARSHIGSVTITDPMWERALLAMNGNAVYRPNRPGQPMMFFGRGVA